MIARAARVLTATSAATVLAAASTVVLTPSIAHAAASTTGVAVTEVSPWASGSSPYAVDWFELTNFTSSPVTVTGWKTDDNSNNAASADTLTGITSIAAGESVVYLQTTSAATVQAFKTAWFPGGAPAGLQVGTYTGASGGLGTGGDAVNVWNSANVLQTRLEVGASPGTAPFATFDNAAGVDNAIGGTFTTLSVAGTNGAFVTCSPPAAANQTAIGSPGAIGGTPAGPTSCSSSSPSPSPSPTSGPAGTPWPGGQTITPVDQAGLTTSNLSGLKYDGSGATGRIWAAQNGPGVLYKLAFDGTSWVPETGEWSAGKQLHYPDGTGDPDAEGVTFGGPTSADGIYVSTERDNSNSSVSKKAVLRFDPNATGAAINATAQWDLTSAVDSAANDQNLGLEGIAWIPDSYLVANGLKDDATGLAYDPASYPNHGAGLFFVGLESNGKVYGFALDQGGTTFHKVTTFSSGFPTIMELAYDPDNGLLWAHCDNTCSNATTTLQIAGSPSAPGTFAATNTYLRPTGMPDTMNNEGFTITPSTECAGGLKPVYWSDDGDTGGFSLRQGSLTCSALTTPPSLPEFPAASVALIAGFAGAAGVLILTARRRSRRPLAA